jgi:hypothetical protein
LQQALSEERRKSSADEAKIRQLEYELNRKVEEAADNYKNMMSAQRKSQLTEEEIQKLKIEIERERR